MCWSWKVFQAMECYENNKKHGLPNEKKKKAHNLHSDGLLIDGQVATVGSTEVMFV